MIGAAPGAHDGQKKSRALFPGGGGPGGGRGKGVPRRGRGPRLGGRRQGERGIRGRGVRESARDSVKFGEQLLPQYETRFRELADKQSPEAMLVTCSDSRLLPDVLAGVEPGELFVMRNVGNMVPPATVHGDSTGDLSEASAIEYSVLA